MQSRAGQNRHRESRRLRRSLATARASSASSSDTGRNLVCVPGEHCATTLGHSVRNLEANWDAAVAEVGMERARVWRLYMAASAVGFTGGGLNLHQVLGVVQDPAGGSGMSPTRPV